VKTRIAFLLSFLLLFSVLADGIELRWELEDTPDEEASSLDDLAISLKSNHSWRFRSRRAGSKFLVKLLRGFSAAPKYFLSHPSKTVPSGFSQQELYRLQEVFRL
jgi:hypothetical protein